MIKELDLQELQEIYATRMRDDFPPESAVPSGLSSEKNGRRDGQRDEVPFNHV